MNTTMTDVARLAGVSVATVSHVLNYTRPVADATRERVLAAIAQLNYQPNLSAKSLKTGRNRTIGFVIPDISNLFNAVVIEHVEPLLGQQGYSLLLVNTGETKQVERRQLQVLAGQQVSGIVLSSTFEDYRDIEDVLPQVPIAFFDRELKHCPYGHVGVTAYQAYYEAVASLIDQGHRRIGLLVGLDRLSTSREREAAYKAALCDRGIAPDPALVYHCSTTYDQAIAYTASLIDAGCTTIVAANRSLMLSAICYLCSKGLGIGRDIELVGTTHYNLTFPFADRIHQIQRPIAELSARLTASLLDCIKRRQPFTENIHLPSTYLAKAKG